MQNYEHEIPNGSKLYFGKSASAKRRLEREASELLQDCGFSEIITPFFSYHQRSVVKEQKLLRFSDKANASLALRSDSTVDVVRIITRRLKDEKTKKWFYIQPVFSLYFCASCIVPLSALSIYTVLANPYSSFIRSAKALIIGITSDGANGCVLSLLL